MDDNRDLIKACLNGRSQLDESECFDNTNVYKVVAGDEKICFWNSSNSKRFDHKEALKTIAEELLDDNCEGHFMDIYNGAEIMWEIKNI